MAGGSIVLEGGLETLADFRRFVGESAAAMHVDPDFIPELVLAVDEAVSNVFMHGYGGGSGRVELRVADNDGDLVVTIRDHAETFDTSAAPTGDAHASLGDGTPGGLGLFLIQGIVDEVTHAPVVGGGNLLTLTKHSVIKASNQGVSPGRIGNR